MRYAQPNKKGLVGWTITDIVLWVIFFIIASAAVYFALKK